MIADWFRGITGTDLRPTVWRPPAYETYLATMSEWSHAAGVEPDQLEEAAFTAVATARGSQWAAE